MIYNKFDLIIVVPCYDEELRLNVNKYISFLKKNPSVLICFVNDGSKDSTCKLISENIIHSNKNSCIINCETNLGKALAVRTGMLYCLKEFSFEKIAYLDADLSTSLEECLLLSYKIKDEVVFVFGSRIAKIDTTIKRKKHRFIIGRIISTFISVQLSIKVYDTQCGCKVFRKKILEKVFRDEFISKWLFDVEIFHRIIHLYNRSSMKRISREVPLKSWIDTDNSKVKFSYVFKLWLDLYRIGVKYKSFKD
jgi:hypothetical protein